MPGTFAGSYVAVLRRPSVVRTFGPALVGRLAYGLLPLTLLFTVQQATASFAQAATAMAVNGVAALSMPLKSRAVDMFGQRVVLPLVTAAAVAALGVGAVMARAGVVVGPAWWAVALAIGLASPPLGPCMRAQWRRLVPDDEVAVAYSLDAVCEEALYLVGPALAAALLAVGPASTGLPVAAGLLTVGTAGLAASPAGLRPRVRVSRRRGRGALRHRRLCALLLVVLLVGVVIATINTSTAARALAAGHPSYAGAADAAVALGSVTGGLVWGRLSPDAAWTSSVWRLLSLLGTGLVIASAPGPYVLFSVAVGMAGLAISPILVAAYRESDALVEPAEVTEASTWVNTATNLGTSLGGAGSGLLVDHVSTYAPTCAGAMLALTCAVALARRGGPYGRGWLLLDHGRRDVPAWRRRPGP